MFIKKSLLFVPRYNFMKRCKCAENVTVAVRKEFVALLHVDYSSIKGQALFYLMIYTGTSPGWLH